MIALCTSTSEQQLLINMLFVLIFRWCGLSGFLFVNNGGFPGGRAVKNLPAMQEPWVLSLDQENHLEKETATHGNILAWEIPWTDEPGRLQSMRSQRVGYNLATNNNSVL